MKLMYSLLTIIMFTFGNLNITMANMPLDTLVVYVDGEQAQVKTIENGAVNLYSTITRQEKVKEVQGGFYEVEVIEVERYFIGNGTSTEEIVPANYKKLIVKYLPNAPYLHKKLGKLGFRFENITQMVEFYNRFRAKDQLVNIE